MAKVFSTREEVAALAGVSPITVSRCYSDPESVSPKRRAQILNAASVLGYFPNRGASLMRNSASGRLVLIERRPLAGKEWEHNRLYDYLFKSTYHGVFAALSESIYSITYIQVIDNKQIHDALASIPLDGIIGMNFEYPEEIEPIIQSGIPYVLAHHTKSLYGFNRCYTDNYAGGKMVGEYLQTTGHKKVAYVTYDPSHIVVHGERFYGFREGIGQEHICLELDPGIRGKEGGEKAARMLLEYMGNGGQLDGIAVLNDETAVALAQILMEAGVSIPDDVSLIGYDNNPVADYMPFRLATIDLNLESVYHRAVSALIRNIKTKESIDLCVNPTLITGDSVKTREYPDHQRCGCSSEIIPSPEDTTL